MIAITDSHNDSTNDSFRHAKHSRDLVMGTAVSKHFHRPPRPKVQSLHHLLPPLLVDGLFHGSRTPIDEIAVRWAMRVRQRNPASKVSFLGIQVPAMQFEQDVARHPREIADQFRVHLKGLPVDALGKEIHPDFLQDVAGIELRSQGLVEVVANLPPKAGSEGIDHLSNGVVIAGADARKQGFQFVRLVGHHGGSFVGEWWGEEERHERGRRTALSSQPKNEHAILR